MLSSSFKPFIISWVLIVLLVGCAARNPYLRQHSDIDAHCDEIKNIAIFPPNVKIFEIAFGKQPQLLAEEMEQTTKDLVKLIAEELSKRGFNTTPFYQGQTSQSDSEKIFQEFEIEKLYINLSEELAKSTTTSQKKQFECLLGDEVKSIISSTNSDALFLAMFKGYSRTAGSISADITGKVMIAIITVGLIIPPKAPSGYEELQAALVDAKTGDVLWFNRVIDVYTGFIPPDFQEDEMKKLIKKLFKDFPK